MQPLVKAWPPSRHSEPLSPEFTSLFDRYEPVFKIAWLSAFGYTLDHWQVSLLRSVTELRPDGHLRYRQVLISLGRQNGKTEIAAALGLLFMLHKRSAYVVGIASSAEQARLVYDRTMNVIRGNGALAAQFERLTDTRGIQAKDGSKYEIKAAKSAALQGLPIDLGICDEVHLLKHALWTDLLNGTGGRVDCIVVGITTAGDDDSELLKHLYGLAETGKAGAAFGHFIWEAPESRIPDDDETLGLWLAAANPAIADGRVDLETVIADVRSMPEPDAVRYRLNRFIAARGNVFLPASLWHACAVDPANFPRLTRPVIAIDQSPGGSWATVTASQVIDGLTYTKVLASLPQPNVERLSAVCASLYKHNPALYVVDGYSGRALGAELKKRGYQVAIASQADNANAAALMYAKTAQRTLRHASDPLLSVQLPRTVRKNIGENYRISRQDSSVEIDSVISTSLGVYFAENVVEETPMLIVVPRR